VKNKNIKNLKEIEISTVHIFTISADRKGPPKVWTQIVIKGEELDHIKELVKKFTESVGNVAVVVEHHENQRYKLQTIRRDPEKENISYVNCPICKDKSEVRLERKPGFSGSAGICLRCKHLWITREFEGILFLYEGIIS